MLSENLKDKLQYFNPQKFQIEEKEVLLKEKSKQGMVNLTCKLDRETLIFQSPEENVLPYLDPNKKYATTSPDKFLFQLDENGNWILHIMEFKKSVNTSSLKKSKIQFVMGIYNARAIAGFLGIEIRKIYVYSAYRNDKCSMIEMRYANINSEDLKILRDWQNGMCKLVVDLKEQEFMHTKIHLEENGSGTCKLNL